MKASVQHAADTTQASSVEQSTTMDTEENILSSSAQVEMPFVPASQRAVKSRAGSTVDDAIVMVGQTRRKKRKRTKDAKSGDGTPKTENEDEETAPFDFDSAPNILDDAPAAEQSAIPRKKAKQAKGMVFSFRSKSETQGSCTLSWWSRILRRLPCASQGT